ncbi:MAG TPA: adenylate kinase [Sedimentisphaerales bacterium]|nr:adenylate kinase [Sedimentisphaerales bacterium]
MKIVLLGPPGAGKGTQCRRISERYEAAHLSSGDILRNERKTGTLLGRQAQQYMDSGALVPDQLIIDMMIGAIKKCPGGYLLDGFPRTVAQGEALDKALNAAGEKIDAVLNLKIDDAVIIARMSGRRSCPKCGAVYHIANQPPKVAGICDNDGEKLVQRPDDEPGVVANRLKIYHAQTAAVVGYYQRVGRKVIDIDADQPVDQVSVAVFARLDALR